MTLSWWLMLTCVVISGVLCVDELGRRLELSGDAELAADAHLCYIVSGNTERLVASWDKVLSDSASHDALQVTLLP